MSTLFFLGISCFIIGFFSGAKWATFYMADHWPEIREHLDKKIEEERESVNEQNPR